MVLMVEQILSIVTFFLTVRSMVRAWWKAKTVRYSEPLQASPIESALINNLVLPVQLDSLSIRSVGVPPRDRGLKQEPLTLRPFEKEPDTRTNGLIDLLFVKSSSDDKLYTGRQNNNLENVREARVDAVGSSEETSGVRQENDEDTRTEPLPLKTYSHSSVSTTPSCRVVWVPWRVWIEHMSTAEFQFHWVNPLRQLRKIWKRTKKSSNGTNGSKNEHGKKTIPETAVVPRQYATALGEMVANRGSSPSDKKFTGKTGGKEGQDKNRKRPEVPVEDRVEAAVLPEASTSDKVSDDNTESIQDNTGCVRATLVEDWCNCIKYHLRWRFPSRRSRASSYADEPVEFHAQEQTDLRGGDDKKTTYADRNSKLPPEKDITAMESTLSNNTTSGINGTWMNDMGKDTPRTAKKGKEASRKKSSGTNDSGTLKVMNSSDQSTSVTSKSQNSHASQPSPNKVEGTKSSQNTTKNRRNRTAISSFVRIFQNAKLRWNNPFKRTAPSNTDDLKGFEDHQVVAGSLESDKTRNIQETPVIAFDTAPATCDLGEALDAANHSGTNTDTATTEYDQGETQDPVNNPGTNTDTATTERDQGETQDPANNPGTNTDTATTECDQGETQDPANNPGTNTPDPAPAANSQVPLMTPAQSYKPAGQPVQAWEMAGAEMSINNRVYGLTTPNSYIPATLFLASNQQQPNPANPSSTKTDCGVPSGVPSSPSEPTPLLFFVSSQSQPRQPSSTIPSTRVRVAPEVPSSSTEPSKENGNKRKRFSFFRSKSRQTNQGAEPKPRRFSKQRNTIRPL